MTYHRSMRRGMSMIVAACILAGCHQPAQPEIETAQTFADTGDEGFERIWGVAQDVLRRNGFRLDRLDRRAGVITTFPETSQHFFESWRHDVDTPYDFAEASLRTVRRWVEVGLHATPDHGWDLTLTVHKEYFASPERQLSSSASVLRAFGSDLPGVRGEIRIRPEDEYWIDGGRDEAMETWLIDRITRRVEKS
jgi:hypothetical protein